MCERLLFSEVLFLRPFWNALLLPNEANWHLGKSVITARRMNMSPAVPLIYDYWYIIKSYIIFIHKKAMLKQKQNSETRYVLALLIETASHTNIAQFQIIREDKTVTQLCISENMTTSWRNNYTIYFIFHGTLRVITNCKRP